MFETGRVRHDHRDGGKLGLRFMGSANGVPEKSAEWLIPSRNAWASAQAKVDAGEEARFDQHAPVSEDDLLVLVVMDGASVVDVSHDGVVRQVSRKRVPPCSSRCKLPPVYNRDDADKLLAFMKSCHASDLSLLLRGRSRVIKSARHKRRVGQRKRAVLWWNAEERRELAQATVTGKKAKRHVAEGRSNARLAKRLQGRLGMRYAKTK